MDFTLLKDFQNGNPNPGEWNALTAESITRTPFQRYEYLHVWWETRGGGEWPQAELALVTAHQDGILIGIAPLFRVKDREGISSIMLLGSIEISDYLDLIVRPSELGFFVPGLLDFLSSSFDMAEWQMLDWHNLPDNSPTLPVLKAEAEKRGWLFTQEQTYHAPSIPLPDDFEIYLAGIEKKQRHEIRRKMRRIAEAGITRWYITKDLTALDADVDAFMALMAGDPAKAIFLTEDMRRQMHLTCRAAFENNWLQLAFLEVDGQKAAGYLNFDFQNRIWVYNSGVDRRFMDLSPGWVLLGYLLLWAIENGRTEFDFMRGEEDYKYKFGAKDHFVIRALIARKL